MIDLSVGSPVDSVPLAVRGALTAASDDPNAYGYPATAGTADLREAIADWFRECRGVDLGAINAGVRADGRLQGGGGADGVRCCGWGRGDVVVQPRVSYPTYEIGTQLAGATVLKVDDVSDVESWRFRAEREGRVGQFAVQPHGRDAVARMVRMRSWRPRARSARWCCPTNAMRCWTWRTGQGGWRHARWDPQVCEGSADGVLVLYSLSKQSNMAGYRTAFIAGDYALVARMTAYRKQIGQIIPGPVQAAMAEGLRDGDAVREQKARYEAASVRFGRGVAAYGYDAAMPQGALYVWVKARSGDLLAGYGRSWRGLGIGAEPRGVLRRPGVSAVLRHRHRWGDRRRCRRLGA